MITIGTREAIRLFEVNERKEHQLERSAATLHRAVRFIPDSEMQTYVEQTEKLRRRIARKCRTCPSLDED